MRIQNQVALVTGASRGIGEACARALLSRGAAVAACARTEPRLAGAFAVAADLTTEAGRAAVIGRTLDRFGRIDILVNNAGVGLYAPSWSAPMALVREMFELNFFAALDLIQRAVPHMPAGGAIVNVSSIAGKVTLPWLTAYSAAKHALAALGDGLRIELGPRGIGVLTVCPGYVRTEFTRRALDGDPPAGLARYHKFAVTAGQCAEAILRGLERGARTVVAPRVAWGLVAAHRLAGRVVDRRLARIYQDVVR